jgi:hypothetical protein
VNPGIDRGLVFLLFCHLLGNDSMALTLLGLVRALEWELWIAAVSGVDSMNQAISLCGADADADADADVDFWASLF